MRPVILLFLALAGAVFPSEVPAQEATLNGVRYDVPRGFTPEPPDGDSTTVFMTRDSGHTGVFVATLAPGARRSEVIERVLGRAARSVGSGPTSLRWQPLQSLPASRFEVYHERFRGSGKDTGVVVVIRHLRHRGRDILTGSYFTLDAGAAAMLTSSLPITHLGAFEGLDRLTSSLLGEKPADTYDFSGTGEGLQARIPKVDPGSFSGTGGVQPAPAEEAERPDPEAPAVRAVYGAYQAALRSRDGDAAARLVAHPILEHYGELQRLALHASAPEVRALPMLNRYKVLTLRHRAGAERLAASSPAELFGLAVSEGWMLEVSDASELGRVHVNDGVAMAEMAVSGPFRNQTLAFIRQEEGWRLDLLPTLPVVSLTLELLAQRSGIAEDQLLEQMLAKASGRPVPRTIWSPPLSKAPGR